MNCRQQEVPDQLPLARIADQLPIALAGGLRSAKLWALAQSFGLKPMNAGKQSPSS
jgi:hypothetical protein